MLFFVLNNSVLVLLGAKNDYFLFTKKIAREVLVMIFCVNENFNVFIDKTKVNYRFYGQLIIIDNRINNI
jgi:hypothetical protein